ncbi:MAG: SIMPL domain-containing protein [Clostridia bacterium]|nr:SIMPL domain-containing protein [Clostridia bacterium]MBO7503794.1 SIMPL domain-containing protein [Clostridia bacterium]MBO7657987.1 SIMPL domain-containing protein [Clostridia bacterium]MBP5665298.1 SIMPL domain-containing protein [Clostridia bacterium]MBR5006457.1 SIMPL domain-containing protein [Clostridia bacterium]
MKRTVNVTGEGRLNLPPDTVEFSLNINATDKNYDRAVEISAEKLERLAEAVKPLGFAKEDLKSSNYNIYPEYDSVRDPETGNYSNVFKGFRVNHSVMISFRFDKNLLSDMISAIASSVSEPDLHIAFTLKNREEAAKELLRLAVENAYEKAQVLAAAAGVKIDRVVYIDAAQNRSGFYSTTSMDNAAVGLCKMARGGSVEMAPQDVNLSETVRVIYEIG